MHVVINGTFWDQPNVGSGQYLHGLIRWLPRVAPQHRYTLLRPRGAAGPPLPPGVSAVTLATPFDRRSRNLAKLFFEQVAIPRAAGAIRRAGGPALLFTPYFAPPLRSPVPCLTTVGDVIPLRLPEYRGGPPVRAYMALVRAAARRSAHLLTFSEFSRADVVAALGVPRERITAVLLAADERFRPAPDREAARDEVARRFGVEEPFIYYVGGLDARKNVATLIQAFALLRSRGVRATLAIAGRALGRDRRLFPNLDETIAELGLTRSVRRIDVSYDDGPLLFQSCTTFAFPSRYEGFGLPPLEAMACGAPAVVSDASSLPEVVGAAALRVAPDDVVGWASTLSRLLNDEGLRADLSRLGLSQAARFSWRRVAEETALVIGQVGPR